MPEASNVSVFVVSTNKTKLAAVSNVFKNNFPGQTVTVTSIKGSSGIPHGQPFGLQHTFEGANARVDSAETHLPAAVEETPDVRVFVVAVENGVVSIPTVKKTFAHDICCVVVRDLSAKRAGKEDYDAHNFSQSRPYPLTEVQEMRRKGSSGEEIGGWCKRYYDNRGLQLTRRDQIQTATRGALEMISINGDVHSVNEPDLLDIRGEFDLPRRPVYLNAAGEHNGLYPQ